MLLAYAAAAVMMAADDMIMIAWQQRRFAACFPMSQRISWVGGMYVSFHSQDNMAGARVCLSLQDLSTHARPGGTCVLLLDHDAESHDIERRYVTVSFFYLWGGERRPW